MTPVRFCRIRALARHGTRPRCPSLSDRIRARVFTTIEQTKCFQFARRRRAPRCWCFRRVYAVASRWCDMLCTHFKEVRGKFNVIVALDAVCVCVLARTRTPSHSTTPDSTETSNGCAGIITQNRNIFVNFWSVHANGVLEVYNPDCISVSFIEP